MNLKEDIQPLTAFRNDSVKMLQQLRKTGRPIILTVNGRTAAVVQDAEAYQQLLARAALMDEREGLRQAEEDVAAGRTRPAAQILRDMRQKHAMPR
jgi:prevent-host-death family protein